MGEVIKIECKTKEIIKSKKTGKTYENMQEFLKENTMEDLQKDLNVMVTNKGLDLMNKIFIINESKRRYRTTGRIIRKICR